MHQNHSGQSKESAGDKSHLVVAGHVKDGSRQRRADRASQRISHDQPKSAIRGLQKTSKQYWAP